MKNNDLLIRIDERVQVLHRDIPEIKSDIKEIKSRQDIIRELQIQDHEDLKHVKIGMKKSVGYKIDNFIRFILRI